MPYTGDPANSATDRLRLEVGDTDVDAPELTDQEYQYYLDKNNQNESKAYIDVLKALVAKYAKYTRERAGQVEIYGQEKFKNYQQLLDDALDPRKGNFKMGPGYSGGTKKQRVRAVRDNANNNHTDTYQGWSTDPDYTSYDNAGEVFDAED